MSKMYAPMKFTIDISSQIIEVEGIKFDMDTIEPFILHEIFGRHIHEVIKTHPGGIMLDIGACFGDSALYFASKGCKVYAVEPNPVNYRALLKNISLNPTLKDKIIPINAAIGEDGYMNLYATNRKTNGGARFDKPSKYSFKIKSYSICNLMSHYRLRKADYMKMDCKGGEKYLSLNDLSKIASQIYIERGIPNSEELYDTIKEKLVSSGFKIKDIRTQQGFLDSIYASRN